MNYVVVVGSALRGIVKVVGDFFSEQDAESWIKDNPQEPGLEVVVVPVERAK